MEKDLIALNTKNYWGTVDLRKKARKLKRKNLGPKITITIENWGGAKRQTITGFPISVNINNRPGIFYSIGAAVPLAVCQSQTKLSIDMEFSEIKNEK